MSADQPQVYYLRRARRDDIADVVGLRIEAEKWLAGAGIEQWTVRTTGEENIRAYVDRGTTYVVGDTQGKSVASLTIDGGDPQFWSTEELGESAAYLYKFMVGPGHRGTGLGDALLQWACRRIGELDIPVLRLDCWKTNTKLHKYYLDRGFVHVDTRDAVGRMSGALFERLVELPVAVQGPPITLVDTTSAVSIAPTMSGGFVSNDKDRYDPDGEAAIWVAASQMIENLKRPPMPGDDLDYWNAALDQAARVLDNKARTLRQAAGMYYRPITGVPRED